MVTRQNLLKSLGIIISKVVSITYAKGYNNKQHRKKIVTLDNPGILGMLALPELHALFFFISFAQKSYLVIRSYVQSKDGA